MMMTLDKCKIGERVRIHSLNMKLNNTKRLMDMGLLPGTILEVTRVAPFGDPLAIKLRGFQMTFRKKEAAQIIVEAI